MRYMCHLKLALQSLGCKGDAISPSKKEGESCVTAIYDDEGTSKVSRERAVSLPLMISM